MATVERTFQPGPQTGFFASHQFEYVVSASGSIATAIDLGRPYAAIAVVCDNAAFIPSRALKARVSRFSSGSLNPLWKANGSAEWVSGTLPTSGGFDFLIADAFYVQRIQLEFTGTVTAGGTLRVSGFESGIG